MSQEPTKPDEQKDEDLFEVVRNARRLVGHGRIIFVVYNGEVVRVDTETKQILQKKK